MVAWEFCEFLACHIIYYEIGKILLCKSTCDSKFPAADRKPAGGFVKLIIWATYWQSNEKYGLYCKVRQKLATILLPDYNGLCHFMHKLVVMVATFMIVGERTFCMFVHVCCLCDAHYSLNNMYTLPV